jgi:hypothetical protein
MWKKTAKYYCRNKHAKDCKCSFAINFAIKNGIADTLQLVLEGKHSYGCCIKMDIDPDTYDWDGKAKLEAGNENENPNLSGTPLLRLAHPASIHNYCYKVEALFTIECVCVRVREVRPAHLLHKKEVRLAHLSYAWRTSPHYRIIDLKIEPLYHVKIIGSNLKLSKT